MTSTPIPDLKLIQGQPSVLTIHSTANEVTVTTGTRIKKQSIMLQNVRLQFDSDVNALAKRVVYLDLPFFNSGNLVDENVGRAYIPLFVGSTAVTIQNTLQLPIQLESDVPITFKARLLGSNFVPVADLVSFTVQFSFLA